jgi:alpha-tubulin suppressor-like RCC1 family protein
VVVDVVGLILTNKAMTFPRPVAPQGEVGQPYTFTLQPRFGLPPYTAVVTAGSVPELTIAPGTDVISGTPTVAMTSSTTVRVYDSSGASISQILAIKVTAFASDALWGWGSTSLLGTGNPTASVVPLRIANLAGVAQAAVNATNGYVRTTGGTVQAWGTGTFGGLGNGSTTTTTTPVTVSGLTSVGQLAVGEHTAYALKSDGTVWAWGAGTSGELGNGGAANSSVPVQVTGLTSVVAIGAGAATGYAVKSDGTVRAWGAGVRGQLGDGTTTASAPSPVTVSGLAGVAAVSGGNETAYALKSDGTVWSWGDNFSGELGNGSSVTSDVPVQVTNLTQVTEVAAGDGFALAVKGNGSAWAWGNGVGGQLGDGQYGGGSGVPVQVSGLTDVHHVAAAISTGYAVTGSGAVWAWGTRTDADELGDGVPAYGLFSVQLPGKALTPPVVAVASSSLTRTVLAVGSH